jgi:hypothetical protein
MVEIVNGNEDSRIQVRITFNKMFVDIKASEFWAWFKMIVPIEKEVQEDHIYNILVYVMFLDQAYELLKAHCHFGWSWLKYCR